MAEVGLWTLQSVIVVICLSFRFHKDVLLYQERVITVNRSQNQSHHADKMETDRKTQIDRKTDRLAGRQSVK